MILTNNLFELELTYLGFLEVKELLYQFKGEFAISQLLSGHRKIYIKREQDFQALEELCLNRIE